MRGRPAVDVAVYAPLAGPLYAGGASGGAEVQSVHLARALAAAGLRVRHLVLGATAQELEGVDVVPLPATCRSERFAARRLAITRALRDADASVYVQRSAGFETGVVGAVARSLRRRFVFSSSSNGDFIFKRFLAGTTGGSLDHLPTLVQYGVGLLAATHVVVQTEEQLRLARRLRIRALRVIPSFCVPQHRAEGDGDAFLWVGGLTAVKDPLAYVRLAESVPEARFVMVAVERGDEWRALADSVTRSAAAVANLELLPGLPRDELLALYDRARAVVGTSTLEGFPNTFLEAWARGRPALSLRVDPDGVIARHGLGVCAAGSLEQLAEAARGLWRDAQGAAAAGESALAYVRRRHDPAVVGAQWAALVRGLIDG